MENADTPGQSVLPGADLRSRARFWCTRHSGLYRRPMSASHLDPARERAGSLRAATSTDAASSVQADQEEQSFGE